MPANVEIKARVKDRSQLEQLLRQLAATEPEVLRQDDTFFPVPHGRLKLRQENGQAHLIAYHRADTAGPRLSTYSVTPVPEPEALVTMLAGVLGGQTSVRKVRHLYRVNSSRVHLDRVQGLGDFIEIETEVEQAGAEATDEAHALMATLGIEPADLVARAYNDMLKVTVD